jgi:hypothetical protein
MASALTTDEKWLLVESMLSALKGSPISVKASKASTKKEKDPDAPKRMVKPDSFMHFRSKIFSPLLTEMAKATTDEEERKMLKDNTARSQVASALWQKISTLESEARISAAEAYTSEEIMEAFQTWKADPPAVAFKGKKAAKAAAAAAASAATTPVQSSAASVVSSAEEEEDAKPVKPKKVLTQEQKDARKAKSAATKAKKAAAKVNEEIEAVAAALEAPVEEAAECDPYEWKHNFGHGKIAYERIDYEGKAYIYTIDTKTYLGVFIEATNKLDSSIPDPTA